MPWSRNHVPKYRMHRASGQAIVTLGAQDFYLGPHGSQTSKDEYDRLIAEWLANGRRVAPTAMQSLTVEELLAAFWEHAERYYVRPDGTVTKELDAYRQAMKPVRSLYAKTCVDSFGPLSLKAVRERLISLGFARSHINHQIGRIKRVFKWGVENELVSPSVYQGLQAVAGLKKGRSEAKETDAVKPAPMDAVEAVRPYVSRQVWAMVQLQLLTGMRSGEVTIMRGCDIRMSGEIWEYRLPYHKTTYRGNERIVYIGPKAQEILRAFLQDDPSAYLFSPKEAEMERSALRRQERRTPLTPSQRSRTRKSSPTKSPSDHYTAQSYGRAITYAIKKAKVAHWSPHQLRHNAATNIREQHGLEAAQVILGHSRADVTQIYAEANAHKARSVVQSIG